MESTVEHPSAVFVLLVPIPRGTVPRRKLISIRGVGHRRFDPAQGIDLIKQQLEGIVGRDGYLHRLSRSSISAIEQLADCRNPRSLALCPQRQACQLDNNRRRMLTREFLQIAHNFGAPTRIATLALTKFQFFLSVTDLFSGNIIAQWSGARHSPTTPRLSAQSRCTFELHIALYRLRIFALPCG